MKRLLFLFHALLMLASLSAQHADAPTNDRPEPLFKTAIPAHDVDVIAGRPTNHSVTISVMSAIAADARIVFSADGTVATTATAIFPLKPFIPIHALLQGLKPDTRYRYRLMYKKDGKPDFEPVLSAAFHTQRSAKASFLFTLTADSHLDENADTKVYTQTLLRAAADSADFHIDLGDTFMTDKYRQGYTEAYQQYLAQRYYFSLLRSPLFLVLGNHDGEQGGQRPEMVDWATTHRNDFFPNPQPDDFYRGTAVTQNYYAWQWGNALFVVLDPFRYSSRKGNENPWDRTLGKTQYDWLAKTLAESTAKFKFVCIHNLVGGADIKGRARGGAEVARLYEWGGAGVDGKDLFSENRPGMAMPVHFLLKKYHVDVVFHGHDHVYAREERDGIIYQCLPQPGAFKTGNLRYAEEYGYTSSGLKNNPGYLRVKVEPDHFSYQYIDALSTLPLDSFTR